MSDNNADFNGAGQVNNPTSDNAAQADYNQPYIPQQNDAQMNHPESGGARGGAKLLDVSLNGGMDLLGSVVETEMLEQHGGGQDGRGRIGLVLAGDVRSGTVDRLEHGRVFVGRVDAAGGNPGDIDFVVVREGTEGLYCGAGGAVRRGTPNEVATEVSINTAYGVERVVRYAFQLAMKRRKHVTLVHKKNVLVNAGDMWQRIVNKVAEEYPEVTHDYLHIDATTIFMVSNPSRFDVILTDNLFGDIITDEAGAVVGGVGYSSSDSCNESNHISPEPIEAFSRSQTDPTNGKRKCTDIINKRQKIHRSSSINYL